MYEVVIRTRGKVQGGQAPALLVSAEMLAVPTGNREGQAMMLFNYGDDGWKFATFMGFAVLEEADAPEFIEAVTEELNRPKIRAGR